MGEGDQGRRRRDREVSVATLRSSAAPLCAQMLHQRCFAGRGSALKLRAQITSLRLAQASRIVIIAIGIDRAQRLAAASGTTAMPTPAATIWQIASKSRNRARTCKRMPSRAACLAIWSCSAVALRQPDEVAVRHLLKIDLAAAGELAAPRRHQHQPVLAEQESLEIVRQRMLGGKAEIGRAAGDRRDDIGAFAFLDIEADVGMFAQERGERLRQMLRQPGGVGEQMHAGPDAAGISAQDRHASSRHCA